MAIYDKDGNVLSDAYDKVGNILDIVYDVDGNIISSEPYSIDNVVSYYRSSVLSVSEEINALSDQWQSFVFITDIHSSSNEQNSQNIALYLLNNTPCDKIILNGDFCYMEFYETEYDTYVNPLLNYRNYIYPTFGNHENYSGGDGYAKAYECLYMDWIQNKSQIISTNKSMIYYYIDNSETKTRFVFINTSDEGNQTVGATQLAWLEDVLTFDDTTWTAVVIGHVNIDDLDGLTTLNCGNGDEVQASIATCNGNIAGYICGHQHIDDTRHTGTIQHTTLMCDMLDNRDTYDGYSLTDREAGTTSEQAISVISINTTSKDVVIRRIGAGRASTLSYNYA